MEVTRQHNLMDIINQTKIRERLRKLETEREGGKNKRPLFSLYTVKLASVGNDDT